MKPMFHYPEFRLSGHALSCLRAERLVFASLDVAVASGDVVFLEGQNGSGKSSLLRLLAGLLAPLSGALTWQGPGERIDHVRYVGHAEAINPALSCRENLTFWGDVWGAAPAAISDALDALGLTAVADLPARFLSSGQRRRLALARLLVAPAPLWLLDEPTVGLDRFGQTAITAAIDDHCRRGGGVVLATHVELSLSAKCRRVRLDDFQPAGNDLLAAGGGEGW